MNVTELRDKIVRQRALYLAGAQKMEEALRALDYAEEILARDARRQFAAVTKRIEIQALAGAA